MARRAVVVGGVAWNHLLYVDRFPDPAPQTVFAHRAVECVGGTGAGKALNLVAHGWSCELWAAIGDDDAGRRVAADLTDGGVDLVALHDPTGTARHVNLMDATGGRLSIFANAGGDSVAVDPAALAHAAAGADVVAVSILEHCRSVLPVLAGARLWVDLHDYDGRNPHHVEFIEAATYLQLSSDALADWRGFAERRVAAGAELVVCTHGVGGADALSADLDWQHVDAIAVDRVVDTNGAGDGFFAGFATAWVEGAGLRAALVAGARAAADVVAVPSLAPRPPGA